MYHARAKYGHPLDLLCTCGYKASRVQAGSFMNRRRKKLRRAKAPKRSARQSVAAWLIERVLAGKRPNTRAAYLHDLEAFATWLGEPSAEAAVDRHLLNGSDVQQLAQGWIDSMTSARPATLKRRATTLRTLMHWASRYDVAPAITLTIRRTRVGPPAAELRDRLLAATGHDTKDWLTVRDRAIVSLAALGVGRSSLAKLEVTNFDRAAGTLTVGAKRLQPKMDSLVYLLAWIDLDEPKAALFHGRGRDEALSPQAVGDVFRRLAEKAGLAKGIRLRDLVTS